MKLKANFIAPRIDFSRFQNQLKQVLAEAIAEAAFAWLGATTAEIPVWSGASLATFFQLSLAVGFQLDIETSSQAPNRINLGLTNSTGKIDVTNANSGKASFTYGTTLAHLIYNEFNNANIAPDPTLFGKLLNPGPYHFQEKGQRAFEDSAANVRLPNPFDSLTLNKVRL